MDIYLFFLFLFSCCTKRKMKPNCRINLGYRLKMIYPNSQQRANSFYGTRMVRHVILIVQGGDNKTITKATQSFQIFENREERTGRGWGWMVEGMDRWIEGTKKLKLAPLTKASLTYSAGRGS